MSGSCPSPIAPSYSAALGQAQATTILNAHLHNCGSFPRIENPFLSSKVYGCSFNFQECRLGCIALRNLFTSAVGLTPYPLDFLPANIPNLAHLVTLVRTRMQPWNLRDVRTFLTSLHAFGAFRVVGLQSFGHEKCPDTATDLPSFLHGMGHQGHPKRVFIPTKRISMSEWELWSNGGGNLGKCRTHAPCSGSALRIYTSVHDQNSWQMTGGVA
jgi:hypothetical protein